MEPAVSVSHLKAMHRLASANALDEQNGVRNRIQRSSAVRLEWSLLMLRPTDALEDRGVMDVSLGTSRTAKEHSSNMVEGKQGFTTLDRRS